MKPMLLYRIKYDKRDKKVGLVLVIITTVITALVIIGYAAAERTGYVTSEVAAAVVMGIVFWPVTAVTCWIYYLEVCTYLKRLKRHGYEIPNDKRHFSCNLELLPRDGTSIKSVENSRESWLLTTLCLVCFFVVVAIMTYYIGDFWNRWKHVWYIAEETVVVGFMFAVMLITAFLWLVGVFVYWNQRRCDKYRDDVETDDSRKVRRQLADGIIIVIFMLAVTLYVISCAVSMADYAMNSRVDAVCWLIREML